MPKKDPRNRIPKAALYFGANLERMRKAKKWTQEELADKLDLHNSYIGLMERGERIPSLFTVEDAAKVFGVPVATMIAAPDAKDTKDLSRIFVREFANNANIEHVEKCIAIMDVVIPEYMAKRGPGRGKRGARG